MMLRQQLIGRPAGFWCSEAFILCREEWARFSESVTAAERAAQVAEGGFAFAFREGALVKALRQGHWVLLDEINLAPSEVMLVCKEVSEEAYQSWMHTVCHGIRRGNAYQFQTS